MFFRILGPLEVVDGGRAVRVAGRKTRALLVALLTRPNDVVSIDRLLDWLWPRYPPRSPIPALQAHVSTLRRTLEPARSPWSSPAVLLTRPPGYLLRVEPDDLDTLVFQRLLQDGKIALEGGEPGPARALLQEALAQWRGDALADVTTLDAAQAEIRRLEELRLTALLLRIKADLTLGRHLDIIPELAQLIEAHPLHEQLYHLQMLALWRSGRRADALQVYGRARDTLARELALQPALALRQMEAAIVAGEAAYTEMDRPRQAGPQDVTATSA